jgi:hypothetical protein
VVVQVTQKNARPGLAVIDLLLAKTTNLFLMNLLDNVGWWTEHLPRIRVCSSGARFKSHDSSRLRPERRSHQSEDPRSGDSLSKLGSLSQALDSEQMAMSENLGGIQCVVREAIRPRRGCPRN